MKFENTRVYGIERALYGMRNPKESYHLSDTEHVIEFIDNIISGRLSDAVILFENNDFCEYIKIGPNDMDLCKRLIKGGSEHRKFLRQIMVSVDITASLYWWKEFDPYKDGTVANRTSTMHTIEKSPITINEFETDDCIWNLDCSDDYSHDDMYIYDDIQDFEEYVIEHLEYLRKKYFKTKDKKYWKELIRWLPESWLQTRTVTMTYENLFAMCSRGQRRFHKLNEWSGIDDDTLDNFIAWARTLPYAQEFLFIDEI